MNTQSNKICNNFLNGNCKFGDKCKFSHEKEECRHFRDFGVCKYGDQCKYIHNKKSKGICREYEATKTCRFGNKCRYEHIEKSQPKSAPLKKVAKSVVKKVQNNRFELLENAEELLEKEETPKKEQVPKKESKPSWASIAIKAPEKQKEEKVKKQVSFDSKLPPPIIMPKRQIKEEFERVHVDVEFKEGMSWADFAELEEEEELKYMNKLGNF